MSQNIVETEYQPTVPIKGMCHEDFQNVAEIFAVNFDKYSEIVLHYVLLLMGKLP